LSSGDTIGVFQCESTGAQRTLRQLKVTNLTDLAVANAFFKPGPATGGMAQTFVRRYRGEAKTDYLHPALEPILRTTKGVLLFQEQILRVAREIAGLTWAEADQLRRGMSKFEADRMVAIRERFIEGCLRPDPDGPAFTQAQASTLWEQVEAFAGYGFNQGHATAYADVSYRSAWLKAHWPAEFLCARLQDWGGFHHQAIYIAEAIRLGYTVRPPHVNFSGRKFILTGVDGDERLWMGLGQVRDLRRKSVTAIVEARQGGRFTDLGNLLRRVSLQPKELRHLVQCGALDGLGMSRAAMLAESGDVQRKGGAQQMAFAFATRSVEPESPKERLVWERHILGQPLSVHPLNVEEPAGDFVPLAEIEKNPGRTVQTRGVRLPGWTGSRGFFVGDQRYFLVARPVEGLTTPPVWEPLHLQGRWRVDKWGGGWLQIERIE
jgi:DNA polymerase III alpha subunit